MAKKLSKFIGVKQLAKNYAITIQKLRSIMIASEVMTHDGKPTNAEYAEEHPLNEGGVWYKWDRSLIDEVLAKSGVKPPSELQEFCYVQNRHAAERKIALALMEIGRAANITEPDNTSPDAHKLAYDIYEQAYHSDLHCLGGPAFLNYLRSMKDFEIFTKRLTDTLAVYVPFCLSLCTTEDAKVKIEFYTEALNILQAWTLKQFKR